MRRSGLLSSVLRFLKWWTEPFEDDATKGRCPVCGREVTVAINHWPASPGTGWWIPRPVSELTGACAGQHGTQHTEAEVAAAKAEKPWR